MRPSPLRCTLITAVTLVATGCDTSSHDVVIEAAREGENPQSLSVAWREMEMRMLRLEAEVQAAREDTRRLCVDGSLEHPLCARLEGVEVVLSDVSSTVRTLDSAVESVDQRVAYNERTLGPLQYDARSKTVTFTGVNVQIRNGTGSTAGDGDGTGNLIVGWNEADDNDARTGSHNVIVGSNHAWEGHSGVAVGMDHALLSDGGASIGGEANTVAAMGSVLIGGQDNHSTGPGAVAIGGTENQMVGELSVTVGGFGNTTQGAFSMVMGGEELTAAEGGEVLQPSRLGPAGEAHDAFPQ